MGASITKRGMVRGFSEAALARRAFKRRDDRAFVGLESLESRTMLTAAIDLVPQAGIGTLSEVSGHTQLSLDTGGVNVTVTVKVTPTAQTFNTFQLDFDNSTDGAGQLSLSTWSQAGGFFAGDSSLASPSNTYVSGSAPFSNFSTQTTVGTFVVAVPTTPGNYTVTLDKASGVGSGTSISSISTPLTITDFGDLVIHVGGAVVPTMSIGDASVTEGNVAPPSEITLNATIRDFIGTGTTSPNQGGAAANPDFENHDYLDWRIENPETIDPGIVSTTLGIDGKPVFAAPGKNTSSNATNFNQWFNNTTNINTSMALPLIMERDANDPSLYSFHDAEFYPIDDQLFGNTFGATTPDPNNPFATIPVDPIHNWHFTVEAHGTLVYHAGQFISTSSDDDIWVFINNKLVIDRGGVNLEIAQSAELSDLATSLGLVEGQSYPIDIFYAERHTVDAVLNITTNFPIVPVDSPEVRYAIFTATLSQATTVPVSATYTTAAGTATSAGDFVSATGVVNFAAGETSRKIFIPIRGDTTQESTEAFTVVLSSPTGATLADSSGTATITDDDVSLPTVTVTASDANASEAGLDPGQFTFTRTGSTASPLTVNFSLGAGNATNGTDHQAIALQVVIPAGQLSATLAVTPIQDAVVEGAETVVVDLATNAAYTIGVANQATVTIADDDTGPPTVTVQAVDGAAAELGLATGQFTVFRSGSTASSLTVLFTITGTAANGTDYQSITQQVVIAAGQPTAEIFVTPIQDALVEGSETVILTLAANAAYGIGVQNAGTVTIADDDVELPTVTVVASDANAAEAGLDPGQFTFTRTGPTTSALTVNFSLGAGNATNGTDHQSIALQVVIPIGQASVTLPVTPIQDAIVEGPETVAIDLATNAAYTIGAPNAATVTIADDDVALPIVTVGAGDTSASESGDAGAFVVQRNVVGPALTVFFTLSGSASNGGDLVEIPIIVVIPEGQLQATIPLVPIDDAVVEDPETLTLTLSTNAAYTLGVTTTGTITIADNEPVALPSITVTGFAPTAFEDGQFTGAYRFFRTGSTDAPLTVNFTLGGTATAGTDYVDPGGVATFAAGKAFVDVSIVPIQDNVAEGDETVTATLVAGASFVVGSPNIATVTIDDDDAAPTGQIVGTVFEDLNLDGDPDFGEPGKQSARVYDDVNRNGVFDEGEPATFGTNNTGVFTLHSLPAGEHRLRLIPIDGYVITGPASGFYDITLTDGGSATGKFFGVTSGPPTVTVVTSDPSASEAGAEPGRFAITRTGSTSQPLTVFYTITGTAQTGQDFTSVGGSVTLAAGFATQVVLITPIDDAATDPNETVILTLTTKPAYVIGEDSQATLTITDNEAPPGPPNLTVRFDGSVNLPDPILPGDVVNLKGFVDTAPGGDVNATVQTNIYLLPVEQDTPGVNDTPFATTIHKGKVVGGASYGWTAKGVVPDNLPVGGYHFVAFVDATNAVTTETDETDNTITSASIDFALALGNVAGRAKPVNKLTVDGITYTVSRVTSGNIVRGSEGEANSIDVTPDSTGKATITAKAGKNVPARVHEVTVRGSASSIKLAGFAVTGDLEVFGSLGTLVVGDVISQNEFSIGAFNPNGSVQLAFTAANVRNLQFTSAFPIKSITVADWDDADHAESPDSITAPSIGKLTSKGDFAANVHVTNAAVKASLGAVTVAGVLSSGIRSAGNITSVTAGRFVNAAIFAGVEEEITDLPTVHEDFITDSTATIGKVTAKGGTGGASFVASIIAAVKIGSVTLKDVSSAGGTFGLTADVSIASVVRTGKPPVKNLTAIGETFDGDFVLRIV